MLDTGSERYTNMPKHETLKTEKNEKETSQVKADCYFELSAC